MSYTDKTFLAALKPYALEDMEQSGILASLTAAQALIESNKGNSGLATKANNLFGIKGSYNGQSVRMWTIEYYNGVKQRVLANFRKYPSWGESVADHSGLFTRLARYKNLRGCTDYKQACINVKLDGYATAPDYTNTLITTINKYKLYEWDYEIFGGSHTIQETVAYPTLRMGDRSDYVRAWQAFLNMSGYPCGLEDGIFGKNTRIAVIDYQRDHGLTPDGIIGPKTWASIPKAA